MSRHPSPDVPASPPASAPGRSESPARRRLVDALVAHEAEHGLAEQSLRELAEGAGTSHRMLIYHFGSRAGVVAAVAAEVEARQRAALAAVPADADHAGVVEAVWRQVSAPDVLPFVPLFFEVLGLALQRRPGTEAFLAELTTPWVDQGMALARQRGTGKVDEVDARLAVAVVRGLLVDLAATGDHAAAAAALARFTARLGPPAAG